MLLSVVVVEACCKFATTVPCLCFVTLLTAGQSSKLYIITCPLVYVSFKITEPLNEFMTYCLPSTSCKQAIAGGLVGLRVIYGLLEAYQINQATHATWRCFAPALDTDVDLFQKLFHVFRTQNFRLQITIKQCVRHYVSRFIHVQPFQPERDQDHGT